MCSDNRPPVLWDNLTALQPATIKDAQIALFLRKLPRHISTLINTRAFDTTEEMIQRCNAPARGSILLFGTPADPPLRTAARRPAATSLATNRAAAAGPPPGQPRGGRNDGLCFYHSRFGNKAHKCEKGCSYQEN